MTDARGIVKQLGGRWAGSYGLVRCPAHDDRKPSLKIKDDPNKKDHIDLHCFSGCDWRTVKDELAKLGLIESVVSSHRSAHSGATTKPKPSKPERSAADRTRIAVRIWEQSVRLKGTLGWKYFTERRQLHIGLLPDLKHALRWYERDCAVIALMTDPVANQPVGVHRTFLNPDGTKRERKMLGSMGIIRLSPDEDVTHGLGLCEGVEDGLSLLLSGWRPIWAASCARAIETFPVLSGITALSIFSDYDEAG
jgi:hypothetical protein